MTLIFFASCGHRDLLRLSRIGCHGTARQVVHENVSEWAESRRRHFKLTTKRRTLHDRDISQPFFPVIIIVLEVSFIFLNLNKRELFCTVLYVGRPSLFFIICQSESTPILLG